MHNNPLPSLKNGKKRLGSLLFHDGSENKKQNRGGSSRGSTAFTFIEMANRKETSNI